MTEHLVILHTNDMHSHLENWPKICRYLVDEKKQLIKSGDEVLTFDAGDAIDRWHPLTEATNGQANVKLLNQAHYDAVTIGNNEGINNNHYHLNHLYDEANFPVVLDNLVDRNTNCIPKWAQPYKIIVTPKGTRIIIVGLTRAYQDGYRPLCWNARGVRESIPPLLKKIRGKYDVLLLISHMGITRDRYVAEHYPEFDVIIGGHSHILFPHGERDRRSLLAATSKYGHYIGKVSLILKDHRIIKDRASVVKTSQLRDLGTDKNQVRSYLDRGNQLLREQKIAKIPVTLKANLYHLSNIVQVGLKVIMKRTHTQAAMLSSGMFMGNLHRGIVTMKQIHDILPHSIFPLRSVMSGTGLWLFVREVERNKDLVSEIRPHGMGFRGKHFGKIYFYGIEYNPHNQVVYYHHQPLVPDKHYAIGLLDYYMFLPYFPVLGILGKNQILHDKMFRFVFADYLHCYLNAD